MPLRPPELQVHADRPFEDDLLDRRPRVEALAEAILADDGPAVISINGGFGAGKSAFLQMLAADLRARKDVDVQEFNAWHQSYTGDPVIDVVSALASSRPDIAKNLLQKALNVSKKMVRGLLFRSIESITAGVVVLKDVGADGTNGASISDAWTDTEEHIANFKQSLNELVRTSGGKFVLIIDELDRCRPDYTIDTLTEIRHLLAVPGVVIVLGINRTELEYRIKEVFGDGTDAAVFLRRFIDLPIHLGVPTASQLGLFANTTINSAGLYRPTVSDVAEASLAHLVAESFMSLRDAQQMAHFVANVADPVGERHEAWQLAALVMLMLRSIDQSFYEEFVAGARDGIEALVKLVESLPMMWLQDIEFSDARVHLRRSLLELSLPGSAPTIAREDFAVRYADAGLGDTATAELLQNDWRESLPNPPFCTVDETAQQIKAMV